MSAVSLMLRLPKHLKERLKIHAIRQGKSTSAIVSEVVEKYLDQVEEIPVVTKPKKGVNAA
ncbi:MAG: ribbon-helix-helix protein, CopG family [Pseudanabaenaceae cyanobacterium bins.68]|nr:ribbon-helix-helix protein, CopG family [Pseudanabaenaceae cyanobacterium bins.68]